jgi:phasin family protein
MPVAESAAPVAVKKVEKFAEQASATQATEAATKGLHQMQAEVTGSLHHAAEIARTYVDVQRSALESMVAASQIYGEGLKGLVTHAADVNRTQFEHTVAHLRALTGVKSVKEAMSLQAQFARAMTSRALTESSTMVEDYLKVAGEALAPVTARVRETAEKVKHTV